MQTGGSELVVLELAAAARAQGHKVSVFSRAGDLCPALHATGSQHQHWAVGKKSFKTLKLIRRLRTWLQQNPADIIHAHSRLPAWIAWQAISGLEPAQRPQFVSTVHGHYSVSRYSAVMTRGQRVIAVSESIATYIKKHYPQANADKVVVIPPGVDRQRFARGHRPDSRWLDDFSHQFPQIGQRQLLLLPGRVTRLKGHKSFVRLLAGLLAAGADVHGMIAGPMASGKQHYLDEISELALDLGISDRLDYCGNRTDLQDLMARADMVLNLSIKAEAFGRTVNEALSVSTPVIAWDRGGVTELLDELYPQGKVLAGDEAALLDTCKQLLIEPGEIAENEKFGLRCSNRATLDLYAELAR